MKIRRKKLPAAIAVALAFSYSANSLAQQEAEHLEDQIETIVITAPFPGVRSGNRAACWDPFRRSAARKDWQQPGRNAEE